VGGGERATGAPPTEREPRLGDRPPPPRAPAGPPEQMPGEVDGPKGPEPTRFGDWEKAGRCTDF
jgi:hypothetical protein